MHHPSDDIIKRFAQGRVTLAEAARWEQHLSGCEECGKKMGQAGSDSFMELLKQTSLQDAQPIVITTAELPELPPQLRNHSRYEVNKKLGQGGMGMVYQATHRLMQRQVALKLIRADLLATPLAVARFRREVHAAASLAHPNIVTAFDAEEAEGIHLLVMEYVEGKSLDQLVKQKGPIDVPLVIGIARQIAQGLHHAHMLGMIHRDIKPSNVMITKQGKVKILDFGLARWSGRQGERALPLITRTGSHLGTVLYAAPEQLQSASDVNARADQYSLGATMVYMLTGEPPPFILDQSLNKTLSLPPTVPVALRQIIEQLLQPEPSNRYPTAKSVAEALGAITSSVQVKSLQVIQGKGLRHLLAGSMILVVVLTVFFVTNNWRRGNIEPALLSTSIVLNTSPLQFREGGQAESKQINSSLARTPGQWQSLISLIQPSRDTVRGIWTIEADELRVIPSQGACLAIPVKVPLEYDLKIDFTRQTGKHSVGVVLVHHDKQCTFELDAWEQHLAGFQNINGQSIISNQTRRDGYELVNNRRYSLVIEVRRSTIRSLLDGKEVARYEGDGSLFSVDQNYWPMPVGSTLGLLSWQSTTVFHTVQMCRR